MFVAIIITMIIILMIIVMREGRVRLHSGRRSGWIGQAHAAAHDGLPGWAGLGLLLSLNEGFIFPRVTFGALQILMVRRTVVSVVRDFWAFSCISNITFSSLHALFSLHVESRRFLSSHLLLT
jgi:hypothetical protein